MRGSRPGGTWRSGTVDVSGGRLAYHRTGGDGPKLVLSHGLTDNGLCWFRLAQALAPAFDIYMLDARGHGDSSRPSADARHEPGADIAEAIEQLGLVAPIVMGHSVGARATADCAATHPGRVSKVILEDPPFLPLPAPSAMAARQARFAKQVVTFRSLSTAEILAKGKASSPQWHDDDFPAWAEAKQQVDPGALPVYGAPWQASMAALSVPTLLIHGEVAHGSLVTAELAEEIRSINPRVDLVEIAGAGHNVRRENFTGFLRAVRRFLGLES
jgi:N-formylmaleamate deformylase